MKKTTAKKKSSPAPGNQQIDPRFAPVVEAFAKNRQVTRGKMMSSYGLRINGKIFAMFGRGRFVTKLARERVDQLVSAGKGERFDPGHGRLMKEWVVVGEGKADWIELAREAYEFVKAASE